MLLTPAKLYHFHELSTFQLSMILAILEDFLASDCDLIRQTYRFLIAMWVGRLIILQSITIFLQCHYNLCTPECNFFGFNYFDFI